MTGRRFPIGWRLGMFYASLFAVIGVQMPFWPLYLADKGLGPAGIGAAVAMSYLARIVSNPLVGALADRLDRRRTLLVGLAAIGALATAAFPFADTLGPVLLVTLVAYAATSAMLPLADTLSLLWVSRLGLDYGRIRLWGSLAFIAVAGLGGAFLVEAPRAAILWACLATILVSLVAALALPDIRTGGGTARRGFRAFAPLLKSRTLRLFLTATSLIQLSHVLYYGFATLHWRGAGLPGVTIGALWAEGVIAEVALFAFGARLLTAFGPVKLIGAGAAACILRWTVLGLTVDPAILALAQGLHAFTFAAAHLGAMHFLSRAVPARMSAASLGLYASVAMGVVPGLGLLGAGRLYEALGGHAFLVMAIAAVAALVAAVRLGRRWEGSLVVEEPGASPS